MRILITGCSGFVGFNLCVELATGGHTIVGIDNQYDDGDLSIKARRRENLHQTDGVKIHSGSITDRAFLNSIFESDQFDAVIHLAALAGVRASAKQPLLFGETNLMGTLNILDLSSKHKVGKFLFASSSSTYGDLGGILKETDPIDKPLSVYAATKGAMEQICYTYHHLHRLDMGVMRFFTVYGPWGRPNMLILSLIKRVDTGEDVLVFGKGDAVRTYIYVDDIVRAVVALLSKGSGYQIFNFAGTERVTVSEVVSLVEQSLAKTANVVNLPADPNDSADLSGDISHAKAKLGWEPQNSMRTGIDKTVKWYLDNRDWLIDAIPTARA